MYNFIICPKVPVHILYLGNMLVVFLRTFEDEGPQQQDSLKMSPFQALYGRSCRTPLQWDQPGKKQVFGPDILLEADVTLGL
jgi:hypothetical protein